MHTRTLLSSVERHDSEFCNHIHYILNHHSFCRKKNKTNKYVNINTTIRDNFIFNTVFQSGCDNPADLSTVDVKHTLQLNYKIHLIMQNCI